MDKKEFLEAYEKNVDWLKRNIPPDDIYDFTEQTFMAAMFFLKKYTDTLDDVKHELESDKIFQKWTRNIFGLMHCRDNNIDTQVDLKLMSADDDDEDDEGGDLYYR